MTLRASSQLGSQPDTYFFSLAQAEDTFAVIGSDDNLRIFDLTRLSPSHVFPACNEGVQCLERGIDERTLWTAGRDGVIRGWDARARSRLLEIKEPRSSGISAIACHDFYIAAGTESTKEGLGEVSVHVFDTRKPAVALRTYGESHTDTITDITWHPSHQNLLLTGSTDGLVSIFDVEQADEEDAIQQVLNPRSAVHCAGFLTDHQAYVLSTDEHFTIYGLNKTGTEDDQPLPVAEYGDVRPELDCMYVIKLMHNHLLPCPILAHGHNEKLKLALTSLDGANHGFGRRVDLSGAHGDEVVRDVILAREDTVLSCGEDGHVRVWNVSNTDALPMSPEHVDSPKPSKKKSRKDKTQADRFAPY